MPNLFPYTNTHELNLDWILQVVKDFQTKYTGFDDAVDAALAAIEAARTGSLTDIGSALTTALDAVTSAKADALEAVGTATETARGTIASDLENAQSAIASDKADAQAAIASDLADALSELAVSLQDTIDALDEHEADILNRVTTLLQTLPADSQEILSLLNIVFSVLNGNYTWLAVWEAGYYTGSTGVHHTIDDTYISTERAAGCAGRRLQVTCETGYIIYEISYWDNDSPENRTVFTLADNTAADVQFPATAKAFSITIRKSDSSTITSSDVQGNVTIEWPMDAVEVPSMIAYKETTTTASIAHIVGEASEFFMLNGYLYHALSDIAQYGSIVTSGSGQNVEAILVMDQVTANYSKLKSAISYTDGIVLSVKYGNNLINPSELESDKFIAWQTGAPTDTTGLYATGFIPVLANVLYGFTGYKSHFAFYTNADTDAFVAETTSNDITELDGGESVTIAYTVPVVWFKSPIDGYVRISIPNYIISNNRAEFFAIRNSNEIIGTNFPAYTNGQYQENSANKGINLVDARIDNMLENISGKKNSYVYNFDLASSSTFVQTIYVEDMCNYRISFFGLFSGTFSGVLVIGKGANLDMGGSIKIDSTNIYMYFGNNQTAQRTQPHGLTFKDYISIMIDIGFKPNAKVIVSTNGGTYTWDLPYFRSWRETLTVYTSDTAFTNCVLSYICASIFTDSWLYGDSYFANSGDDRWTAYLINKGYENYLLNGYPGRNSAQALQALQADLAMNKFPQRIVWCMGMNDPDSNGEANASWKSTLETVQAICEEHHIELILATIPLVPNQSYDNQYKNAYVKASGLRYIDFAKAVNSSGTAWYDNMLNVDNIHPDTQGALALFSEAISDVPELLS